MIALFNFDQTKTFPRLMDSRKTLTHTTEMVAEMVEAMTCLK